MGRNRGQYPSVFKTSGKRKLWFFKARIDQIDSEEGKIKTVRPSKRFYVGFVDEIGKREAEKRRDEMLAGGINKPQVFIPSQVKFSEVLKIYRREHLSTLKETTRAVIERILVRHFDSSKERENLGNLRMCDMDVMAIQRWLSGQSVTACTKRQHFRILKGIWGKAEDWGFTQQRFPKAKKFSFGPECPKKEMKIPTMDQLRRLLAALEDPYRAMAEIALFAGLRIGEIRGLKWEDVTAETLSVRRRVSEMDTVGMPKSKRAIRTLDVRPVAHVFERLKQAGGPSGFIFFHPKFGYSMCRYVMGQAASVAGITIARWGWHHLRGAFNTLARSSGADSVDRQALMGHATERMNAVYVMPDGGELRRRGDLMMQVQSTILGETKGVQ
jgi:integrase